MTEPRTLVNELLVNLFNRILAIEGEELKAAGITLSMSEVHVLEAVSNAEEPTMSAIAKKLGVTFGSATTSIGTLVQKGFVTRHSDEDDRRKVLIALEPPAHKALKIHKAYHERMIDSIFTDLKIGEDDILIASLQKVVAYFEKE